MTPTGFSNYPSSGFAAVTADDTAVQPKSRGVVCLTSGNLVAKNAGGDSVTFPMTAGQWLPISPTQITTASTGTYALLR